MLTALLLGCTNLLWSQKEYNNWYFGDSAGVTFNSGIPVGLNNGIIFTSEGTASISDKSGNLLFYTDGVTVRTHDHSIMDNGTNLMGSLTSTQSAMIIPLPGCDQIYYIFTVYLEGTGPLCYSLVDMRLNSGFGKVVQKNVFLHGPVCEKLTAIFHRNGVDVWIIAHAVGSNDYLSFLLTNNGVNPNPVINSIGEIYSISHEGDWAGYLKPAPRSGMLADANPGLGIVQLLKFNNLSGALYDLIKLKIPKSTTLYFEGPYGIEFSPDNHTLFQTASYTDSLFQFQLSSWDSLTIASSRIFAGLRNIQLGVSALQMAPDGKIYIPAAGLNYLSCIESPNEIGIQCNLMNNAVYLGNAKGFMGLPNNPFTAPYIQYDGCYLDAYSFHLTDTSSYIHWDFGDPANPSDTAQGNDVVYHYATTGTYTVTAIYLTDWNTLDTVYSTVWTVPKPSLFQKDSLFLCCTDSILLEADSVFDTYLWNTGETGHRLMVGNPGTYSVTASDCKCAVTDSIIVLSCNHRIIPTESLLCKGASVLLTIPDPIQNVLWSNGSQQNAIVVNTPGTYWAVMAYDTCQFTDTCILSLNPVSMTLGADTIFCQGQTIVIEAIGVFDSLQWSDETSLNPRFFSQPGTYIANAWYQHCQTTDTLIIKACSRLRFPNVFTPNGDQYNEVFKPDYESIADYHLLVLDRWGRKVFESKDPEVGWNGQNNGGNCTAGTYFFTATYKLLDPSGDQQSQYSGVVTLMRE